MPRCPECHSMRVVVVVRGDRPRAFCTACGARWQRPDGEQVPANSGRVTGAGTDGPPMIPTAS
jgi:hypothetical protein